MEKTRHSKTIRISIIAGATLAVVLLICRLTLPYIIKHILERELTSQLGVKTTIGDVSLGLFRGSVTLREIVLDNPPGFVSKPFLSVQKIFLNAALTSLLGEEIQIELVDIQGLALLIQRTEEGHINLRTILKNVKSASPPPSSPPIEKPARAQPDKGIFLNLFQAEDVQIFFEDYAILKPPLLTELKDMTFLLKSFRYPDTSSGTMSEIAINGQLVATQTSPFAVRGMFQLGNNPPSTINSDLEEKIEDIYVSHFNPYIRRYGYIFKSGTLTTTYTGKTVRGQINGLASVRFEKVQFEKTDMRLSTLILGIPLQSLPQVFQGPGGTLELTLEVGGDMNNPQISWSKLSEQLLVKTLGNAFRTGSIQLKKPFDLITGGFTQNGKDGSVLQKLRDMLNPQTPAGEEKEEVQEERQKDKDKVKDFFKGKLLDQLDKLKK
ncbi:MAG: DUF748 domain-containing protein [Candidatus Brocadia sp.]|jgi:hypothetical protein